MVYCGDMAERIVWRGLNLDKTKSDREGHLAYGLIVTPELEVSAYSITDGKRWRATVGLGRCDQPREQPDEALDQALRDHLANAERHAVMARNLESFRDFLGLEAGNHCANCGKNLTLKDKELHPGKCYGCAEGR